MRSNKTYSVVVHKRLAADISWEEGLIQTMGVCRTIKKAYQIALFLGGINEPNLNYRQVLNAMKIKGAVELKQRDGEQTAVIVNTKSY